ncbi:MAG: hypothetical protein ABI622_08835 [Chloroflexota bacterium]
MNVLGISALYDAAGDAYRTKLAFDRCAPGWTYRATHRRDTHYGFGTDLPWAGAIDAWRAADVIHEALGFMASPLLHVPPPRKVVVHHHGTIFRRDRDLLLREQRARRARGLVSTLDLYLMAPSDVEWSPSPYNLGWLASLRRPNDGPLRIAHAPTSRIIKSTAAFLEATERLAREVPLEVVVIEGTTWADCLRQKADADIYFDQVALGYGCNAVEAWGMGIPVVAGAAPATLDEIARRAGGLPFVVADEGTIYDALRLLAEPAARRKWATIGLDFARRFHADEVVVPRLQAVFA